MVRDRHFWVVVGAGLLLGAIGVLLAVWGNPENSGICVSCFIENSAGALGLHDNQRMQYLRPELIGFVLGSAASAMLCGEFRSRGGSAPLPRLFSGIFLIVGCGVFIGCPIKLFLRLAAGDLTAVAGVAGLVAGGWGGVKGLANGVELGPQSKEGGGGGFLVPAFFLLLLAFLVVRPGFLLSSAQGSAARHAPLAVALGAGTLLGAFAQRTRFCITGGIRDALLMGVRSPALWGVVAFVATAGAMSGVTGRFNPGLYGQPGAHLDFLWSFLGMGLVGWISVLIGGCPFRQLIKAGEGDADAGLVVVGMFIGGALVQSWGIAATTAGVSLAGKVAVLAGFFLLLAGSLLLRERGA
ncbi:YedE family putative selenium transporter [Geobacter sp.]|uniref:YedE family putative selenium transporter n=1 Tax=Geobacter sp. TaxID=46610 RepID=UPI00262B9C4D|nr:YedE family putative selenium transporter [Geobacter sp.]